MLTSSKLNYQFRTPSGSGDARRSKWLVRAKFSRPPTRSRRADAEMPPGAHRIPHFQVRHNSSTLGSDYAA
jgi:hypothetical protein